MIDLEYIEQKLQIKIHTSNNPTFKKTKFTPGQLFKHYSPNTPIKLNVKVPGRNDAFRIWFY